MVITFLSSKRLLAGENDTLPTNLENGQLAYQIQNNEVTKLVLINGTYEVLAQD